MKRKIHRPSDSLTDTNMTELEKLIQTQNRAYFDVFDKLAKLPKKVQIDILESNRQLVPGTKYEVGTNLRTLFSKKYANSNLKNFRFYTA